MARMSDTSYDVAPAFSRGASDLFDCSGKHQFCSEERWDVSIDRFLEDDSYLSEVRPPTPCPAHAPAFIH